MKKLEDHFQNGDVVHFDHEPTSEYKHLFGNGELNPQDILHTYPSDAAFTYHVYMLDMYQSRLDTMEKEHRPIVVQDAGLVSFKPRYEMHSSRFNEFEKEYLEARYRHLVEKQQAICDDANQFTFYLETDPAIALTRKSLHPRSSETNDQLKYLKELDAAYHAHFKANVKHYCVVCDIVDPFPVVKFAIGNAFNVRVGNF